MKITDRLFNKSWKKILIVFIVIFLIIFSTGVFVIDSMENTIEKKHVHPEEVFITGKMHGEGTLKDYYLIFGNNTTYTFLDDGKINTKNRYDSIHEGSTYRFIVQEAPFDDISPFTHIIQVYNVTS